MTFIAKHRRLARLAALTLLLIALLGPWSYERVYVPPPTPCAPPKAQVEGDPYCGLPLSVLWEIAGLLPLTGEMLRGEAPPNQWTAQSFLPCLLLLATIMSLGLALRRDRAQRQGIYLLAWSLSVVAGFAFLQRGYHRPYAPPWGLLLYLGVALAALLLELILAAQPARPTPPRPSPGHSPRPGESRRLSP